MMSFPFFTLVPLCLRLRRTNTNTHTHAKVPCRYAVKPSIHVSCHPIVDQPSLFLLLLLLVLPALLCHTLSHTYTHAHILASIAVAAPIRFIATFYFGLIFAATRRGLCCCCYAVASNICYGHKEGMGVNASVCVCVSLSVFPSVCACISLIFTCLAPLLVSLDCSITSCWKIPSLMPYKALLFIPSPPLL